MKQANEITGANAGGLRQLTIRTPWAARVRSVLPFGYVPERHPKPKALRGLLCEVNIFGHSSCDTSRVGCGMEEDETCQCVRLTPRLRCMPAMRVP